jgi:hypothetical protein
MEVLDVCFPLHVPLVLDLALGVDKDQRMMVCMQNSLLAKETVPPLLERLNQTIEFFVIYYN